VATDDSPQPEGWTPGGALRPTGSRELDRWGPLRDFLRDRLPLAVRGGRLDPGVRGAVALAVVALLAAVAAVLIAWSSSARPASTRSMPAPAVAVPKLSGSAPGLAAAVSAPATSVVVEVAGKVRRPGLVKLAVGARVADAISAAGGMQPGTPTTGLSLARRLVDGEQLIVGEPAVVGAPSPAGSASPGVAAGPVNLNTATVSELDALPGIGPVLAQRVVDWRLSHGGFTAVDQLREVSGLGGKKFDTLAPLVTV
jgi:competence protein ComEA